MKQYIILLLTTFAVLAMTPGCKKQTLDVYHAENNIYFNQVDKNGFALDSLSYSFSTDTLTRDSLIIRIGIMGAVTKDKRPFVLKVDESSTAIAGRDYILPPDSAFYIAPDSPGCSLTIFMLRSPSLLQKSVRLLLDLEPNGNFQTNMHVKDYNGNPPLSSLQFRLVIDDSLSLPIWWSYYADYMGVFTRKKVDLFVQFMAGAMSYNTFVLYAYYYPGTLVSEASAFQQYLNQQKAAGNTIYEDDGTEMTMGPDAQ